MTKVLIRTVDFETSDKERKDGAEVIEQGYTDSVYDTETQTLQIGGPVSLLYSASAPLKPEVIAVHHITDDMIRGQPRCTEGDIADLVRVGAPMFLCAHQAEFEQQWLTPEIMGETRMICTYKSALHAWPEAPSHSNQALRYWRGLDLPDALAMPPHRAAPDSFVTAHLLGELLKTHLVRQLVQWTLEPKFYAFCPLKKHKGQPWDQIPADYLKWILTQATEIDPGVRYAARQEVDRRVAIQNSKGPEQ